MSEEELNEDEGLDELAFFETNPDSDPMGIGDKAASKARSRQRRGLFMLAVFVVFFCALAWMLRAELVYFFTSSVPEDLGRAEELKLDRLEDNTFIEISGIARDMCIRAEVFFTNYRFLYFLGSEMGSRIIVQTPVSGQAQCQGAEEGVFKGRVVDLALSSRYDAVLKYYRDHFPSAPGSGPMYVLEDATLPGQAWYYPAALGLMLALVGVNFWLLVRARRQKKSSSQGDKR